MAMMNRRALATLAAAGVIFAACSSAGDAETRDGSAPTGSAGGGDTSVVQPADTGPGDVVSAQTAEALAESFPVPSVVDEAAEVGCQRYGYACSVGDATDAQISASIDALESLSASLESIDDADEQLLAVLAALADMEGVGNVAFDRDNATMVRFSIDGGPPVSVITQAGLLVSNGDLAPIDESYTIEPEAAPTGLLRPPAPARYEPAGGPLNKRSALIIDVLGLGSTARIADLFRAQPDYATVTVWSAADALPWNIGTIGNYDAVQIFTHGGGSCPAWTDDRDECTSTILGGPLDVAEFKAEVAERGNNDFGVDGEPCVAGGELSYCYTSEGFPSNPNGIMFVGACGSDFGFNNLGTGASVGWSGTADAGIAERTAEAFWQLMVTDGVEFRLAEKVIKASGTDDHLSSFNLNASRYTSAVFAGRNLRARDVVGAKIDGADLAGQFLRIDGKVNDGKVDTLPTDERLTISLEGVRSGSEGGVTFKVLGDDTEWKADIDLVRDGQITQQANGYADWVVEVPANAIEIPDVTLPMIDPSAPLVQLEVRAFENENEYTAVRGPIRLSAEIETSGPLLTELVDIAQAEGFTTEGDDLRLKFRSGGGPVEGTYALSVSDPTLGAILA